ncbi:LOG family protein [Acinetobacter stercoris]|uniref:Cytokinin riboside 5'-monophosphate phosphoribohydrolase n=1 Tax=Acinetobacter stercoris TaxID=2126983 RepID=A0A2U3MYG8_9GAMM|nr:MULTISPECIES: TIGR00730 family Rossman fold protein [Acinetobacter]SPL70470.1 LOG family protein ORF6 in fasciation locus [Acinetobacter stercoris]
MNSALQPMTDEILNLNPEAQRTTQPLVALYCGSRPGNNPIYKEKAIQLAKGIAEHGFGIVYGGASIGLMGQVADTVIEHGGEVVGVIPEFMLDYEIAHSNLTELHVVRTMHERKAMMAERANAFIALPGGLGTFEEILEIATWGQLNQHQKPMMLYNVNGFYNALIEQLDHATEEGFLPPQHRAKLIVCEHKYQIFNAIKNLEHPAKFVV